MKNKGIKVKRHRKNFYRKRKSTGRKILEVILVILLLAALVFIGYSVAPPLIKFFSGDKNTSSTSEPAWTPPETTTSQTESSAVVTTPPATTTEKVPEKPQLLGGTNAITAPNSAIQSTSALKKYLETAKQSGYKTVIFNLKDDTGHILYKSTVDTIKDNTTIVTGKLTAAQIVKACKEAEITPAATITTLNDHLIPKFIDGTGYRTSDDWEWLDAAYDKGGQPWATPYSAATVTYLSKITKELSQAGFESIILQDVTFPNFGNYDYSLLPAYLKESARTEKLVELINKCTTTATDSHSFVNIDAANLLTLNKAYYKGTAEVWKSKNKISGAGILITLDVNTLDTTLQISDSESLKVDKDIAKAISGVFTKIKKTAGNTEIAVGISNSSKLTSAQIKSATEAFKKLGYENIVLM